jgi:hypothetical protein
MRFSRYTAVLALSAIAGMAQAAEIVVLESNAVRYAPGQTLDAALPIALAAGEFVAIVTEDARLIRIDGPHSGPAAGPPPDEGAVRRALAQLIVDERPEVGGIGGVRGSGDEPQAADTRPEPWLVHTQRSGDQCAVRGQGVRLWREDGAEAAVAELSASLDDATAEVRWNAGEQRAAWPTEIPLTDETIYLLRPQGSLRSLPVRLHLLAPSVAGNSLAAAAWLAARGCTEQARLLLR